jgi:hypothetical protein
MPTGPRWRSRATVFLAPDSPALGTVSSPDAFRRAYIGRCRVMFADCKQTGRDSGPFRGFRDWGHPARRYRLSLYASGRTTADEDARRLGQAAREAAERHGNAEQGLVALAAERNVKHTHPASARDLPGQPPTRREHARHRPNEPLPLPKECRSASHRSGWGVNGVSCIRRVDHAREISIGECVRARCGLVAAGRVRRVV